MDDKLQLIQTTSSAQDRTSCTTNVNLTTSDNDPKLVQKLQQQFKQLERKLQALHASTPPCNSKNDTRAESAETQQPAWKFIRRWKKMHLWRRQMLLSQRPHHRRKDPSTLYKAHAEDWIATLPTTCAESRKWNRKDSKPIITWRTSLQPTTESRPELRQKAYPEADPDCARTSLTKDIRN